MIRLPRHSATRVVLVSLLQETTPPCTRDCAEDVHMFKLDAIVAVACLAIRILSDIFL